jgi:hypothetical protein
MVACYLAWRSAMCANRVPPKDQFMTIRRVHVLSVAAFAAAAASAGTGCSGNTRGAGQASDATTEHAPASGGSSGSGSGGTIGGGSGGQGLGGSGSGGRTDGGAVDGSPGCESGSPVGTIRPAGDGCNSCICSVGNFWACTTAFCPPDAAPFLDASSDASSDSSSGSGGRIGTGGGGTGGIGGGTAAGGAGGGGAACSAAEMLSRSCTIDTECVAVNHVTDCCGSSRVMGLRAAELDRFRGFESQCGASYPACRCAPRPTLTDDGSAIRTGTNVGIACLGGVCTTFHGACGRPCTGGRVCATCASGPTTYAACTTACGASGACTDVTLPLCQAAFHGDRSGMYCTATGIACGTP